jgi:hypothetical protein
LRTYILGNLTVFKTHKTVASEITILSRGWWCTHVIPVLGKLTQEDSEMQASLGYIVRPCPKQANKHNPTETNNKKWPPWKPFVKLCADDLSL